MAPKRFAMVFWAAKAMASPATPAPVIRAVTFRLKRFCAMKMTAIVQTAAFTLRRIRSESSLLSLWSSLSRFCRTWISTTAMMRNIPQRNARMKQA